MAEPLAPIYVNDERVRVQGDPKPNVAKIVECCGKEPTTVDVFRLENQRDEAGRKLTLEEIIDRTTETNPVWLRLLERDAGTGPPMPGGGQPPAGREYASEPTQRPGRPAPPTAPQPGGPPPGGLQERLKRAPGERKDKTPPAGED